MTLNYVLCGLLLNKELEKFCRIFTHFYSYGPDVRLPRAYEQALLVAMDFQHESVMEKNWGVSVESARAYSDYMTIFRGTRGIKRKRRKCFGVLKILTGIIYILFLPVLRM